MVGYRSGLYFKTPRGYSGVAKPYYAENTRDKDRVARLYLAACAGFEEGYLVCAVVRSRLKSDGQTYYAVAGYNPAEGSYYRLVSQNHASASEAERALFEGVDSYSFQETDCRALVPVEGGTEWGRYLEGLNWSGQTYGDDPLPAVRFALLFDHEGILGLEDAMERFAEECLLEPHTYGNRTYLTPSKEYYTLNHRGDQALFDGCWRNGRGRGTCTCPEYDPLLQMFSDGSTQERYEKAMKAAGSKVLPRDISREDEIGIYAALRARVDRFMQKVMDSVEEQGRDY